MFKVHFTVPGIRSALLSAEVTLHYIMTTFCTACTQGKEEPDTYIEAVHKTTLLVKLLP